MSSLTKKNISRGTEGTLYEVPTSSQVSILDISITNTTASPVACSIYLVPKDGIAAVTNALFYEVIIPGSSIVQWSGDQVINAGAEIQMTGTGITIHIMGEEYKI
jgi:hypothetical protein